MASPHLAVEVLHPQLLAALRMGAEFVDGCKEMAVLAHVERDAGLGRHLAQRGERAPVAGLGHHQRLRMQVSIAARSSARQRAAVRRVVERG